MCRERTGLLVGPVEGALDRCRVIPEEEGLTDAGVFVLGEVFG